MTQIRATGLPAALAGGQVRLVRAKDAVKVYAHPRPQLLRLQQAGLLHRVAAGHYAIVPQNRIGDLGWRPTIEGVAAALAVAEFGAGNAVLMGVTAARIHHAIPRAIAVGVVAVPHRKQPVQLTDREATVHFVTQDVNRLDAELIQTDLGDCLATTVEQTVLDLAHQPALGHLERDATVAIHRLLPQCDRNVLERIARRTRRARALARIDRGQI